MKRASKGRRYGEGVSKISKSHISRSPIRKRTLVAVKGSLVKPTIDLDGDLDSSDDGEPLIQMPSRWEEDTKFFRPKEHLDYSPLPSKEEHIQGEFRTLIERPEYQCLNLPDEGEVGYYRCQTCQKFGEKYLKTQQVAAVTASSSICGKGDIAEGTIDWFKEEDAAKNMRKFKQFWDCHWESEDHRLAFEKQEAVKDYAAWLNVSLNTLTCAWCTAYLAQLEGTSQQGIEQDLLVRGLRHRKTSRKDIDESISTHVSTNLHFLAARHSLDVLVKCYAWAQLEHGQGRLLFCKMCQPHVTGATRIACESNTEDPLCQGPIAYNTDDRSFMLQILSHDANHNREGGSLKRRNKDNLLSASPSETPGNEAHVSKVQERTLRKTEFFDQEKFEKLASEAPRNIHGVHSYNISMYQKLFCMELAKVTEGSHADTRARAFESIRDLFPYISLNEGKTRCLCSACYNEIYKRGYKPHISFSKDPFLSRNGLRVPPSADLGDDSAKDRWLHIIKSCYIHHLSPEHLKNLALSRT